MPPSRANGKDQTHFRVDYIVFRASNEDEALNFHEIRQFGGIELSDTDGVGLLRSARNDSS
jgi:hypothetical protein